MTQLQGMANAGLMAQLHNITQQQQTMQQQTQAMQLLQSMMSSQGGFPAATPMVQSPPPNTGSTGGNPLQQLLLGRQFSQNSLNTTTSTLSSNASHSGSRAGSPRENGNSHSSGHVSSDAKYPITRETIPTSTARRSSVGSSTRTYRCDNSLDRYDGFGAPNPPNESVLENAVKNEEISRELARSRTLLLFFTFVLTLLFVTTI